MKKAKFKNDALTETGGSTEEAKTSKPESRQAVGQTGYRMKAKAKEMHPNAVVLSGMEAVALNGEGYTVEFPGTISNPPKVRSVRGATQAELKKFFLEGNPNIEEFEL